MPGNSEALPSGSRSRRNNIKRTKRDRKKEMTSEGVSRGYTEKILSGPMDLPFFLIIMVLLVMGIIMMFSAGYAWAIAEGNDGT